MHKKAFTLVELLVVIAIIALLIAILAPSLKAAKDLAKATYCMTNLNALNKSALVYAEGNRGYMMVYTHHSTNGFIDAAGDPWKSNVAFASSPLDPKTGLYSDARNYGLVYLLGILGPPEMFYCPSQYERRSTLNNYPKPWGSAVNVGSQFIRTSYMWNPWVAKILGALTGDFTYEDALMVSRHPTARHLTCDLFGNSESFSHTTSNSNRWNLGYMDGHVESFENKELYNMMTAENSDYNPSLSWDAFNEPTTGVRRLLPGAK